MANYANDANAVACYVFSESSGTSVADITSNTNDGSFAASGQPAWSNTSLPSGYSNYKVLFPSNVAHYIDIGNHSSLQLNRDFTLMCWFNPGNLGSAGALISGASGGWYLRTNSSKLNFLRSQTVDIVSGATTLSTSTWYHGAVTVDSNSTANIELFLNGTSDATSTFSGTFTNSNNKVIGCEALGSLEPGRSDITEVAIFSRVLTSTEINDIKDHGIQGGYNLSGSSISPSASPSKSPSISPSNSPSISPSNSPSLSPSASQSPSNSPSVSPSISPSNSPSLSPSASNSPSISPSNSPSNSPSISPSNSPSLSPSASQSPSISPSNSPSTSPSAGSASNSPSSSPSLSPSASQSPSNSPSLSPSNSPSKSPSISPSESPSNSPSLSPSNSPSLSPSASESPSKSPSISPSVSPSAASGNRDTYVICETDVGGNDTLRFYINGVEFMRVNPNGDIDLNGTITNNAF